MKPPQKALCIKIHNHDKTCTLSARHATTVGRNKNTTLVLWKSLLSSEQRAASASEITRLELACSRTIFVLLMILLLELTFLHYAPPPSNSFARVCVDYIVAGSRLIPFFSYFFIRFSISFPILNGMKRRILLILIFNIFSLLCVLQKNTGIHQFSVFI